MTTVSRQLNGFRMDSIKLSTDRSQLTIFIRLVNIEWSTDSSQLNIFLRVGDIMSATVSSQLTKMKTAKRKKMQVVNLLFLPFNLIYS